MSGSLRFVTYIHCLTQVVPVPPARFVFGNSKAVLLTVPDLTETSNLFLVSRVPYASFFDKTVTKFSEVVKSSLSLNMKEYCYVEKGGRMAPTKDFFANLPTSDGSETWFFEFLYKNWL